MPTQMQKRSRNYIVIGICLILGAALLYWRYSTVTIPGAPGVDEGATLTRIAWLTGFVALAGILGVVRGVLDLRKAG